MALANYDEMMAILAGLDAIVPVDMSVAYLTGAMELPVSVMLPFAPDWRSLTGRSESPWYSSMRPF